MPQDKEKLFHHWLRFEWGANGNPHGHGLGYVSGNPHFDTVVDTEEPRERPIAENHINAANLQTWEEASNACAQFYNDYVFKWHPSKNLNGNPSYNYARQHVEERTLRRPQCVDLLEMLKEIFDTPQGTEPDVLPLKKLLLSLVEDGQRHTGHGHRKPQ